MSVIKTAGAASVTFGVSGVTLTGFIIQDYNKDTSASEEETADGDGEAAAVSFYNAKSEIVVEGITNSATVYAPGAAVTINSDAGFVKTFSLKQSNREFKKFRLVATKYSGSLS